MAIEILRVDQIIERYHGKIAVRNLSFVLEKGQILGVLGPSGSGKTTTLGIILGAIRPDGGTFQWFNSTKGNDRLKIGSLLERPTFATWLSGYDNLLIVGAIRRVKDIKKIANLALAKVGLFEDRHRKFTEYSLGMKQRLGIAAALLGDPMVYVLDEPTNGVDPQGIADIRRIILELAHEGKTIIVASHILDEIEKVCSHVAILKDGELLSFGAIDDALNATNSIDVGSDNLQALEACLKKCDFVESLELKKGFLRAKVQGQYTVEDMNRYLFQNDIIANHLVRHRADLETHFLSTLGSHK